MLNIIESNDVRKIDENNKEFDFFIVYKKTKKKTPPQLLRKLWEYVYLSEYHILRDNLKKIKDLKDKSDQKYEIIWKRKIGGNHVEFNGKKSKSRKVIRLSKYLRPDIYYKKNETDLDNSIGFCYNNSKFISVIQNIIRFLGNSKEEKYLESLSFIWFVASTIEFHNMPVENFVSLNLSNPWSHINSNLFKIIDQIKYCEKLEIAVTDLSQYPNIIKNNQKSNIIIKDGVIFNYLINSIIKYSEKYRKLGYATYLPYMNIKELNLKMIEIGIEINLAIKLLKKLNILELNSCIFSEILFIQDNENNHPYENLSTLILNNNNGDEKNFFLSVTKYSKNLENLVISNSNNVCSNDVRKCFENCDKLKCLSIGDCKFINIDLFFFLDLDFINLENIKLKKLKVGNHDNLNFLKFSQKLKNLNLIDCELNSDILIKSLKKCKLLNSLSIKDSLFVKDKTILSIVSKLPKIKYINLDGCVNLTDNIGKIIYHNCYREIKYLNLSNTYITDRFIVYLVCGENLNYEKINEIFNSKKDLIDLYHNEFINHCNNIKTIMGDLENENNKIKIEELNEKLKYNKIKKESNYNCFKSMYMSVIPLFELNNLLCINCKNIVDKDNCYSYLRFLLNLKEKNKIFL